MKQELASTSLADLLADIKQKCSGESPRVY